jgi:hypothetical protein
MTKGKIKQMPNGEYIIEIDKDQDRYLKIKNESLFNDIKYPINLFESILSKFKNKIYNLI